MVKRNKAKNTEFYNEVNDLAEVAKLPGHEIMYKIKHLDNYVKVKRELLLSECKKPVL